MPFDKKILTEGDLINIFVSIELDGFWSDNRGSVALGTDISKHQKLIEASKQILYKAIHNIKGGISISDIGYLIATEVKKRGFKAIKNLTGHGIGRSLHEGPSEIANFRDKIGRAHV